MGPLGPNRVPSEAHSELKRILLITILVMLADLVLITCGIPSGKGQALTLAPEEAMHTISNLKIDLRGRREGQVELEEWRRLCWQVRGVASAVLAVLAIKGGTMFSIFRTPNGSQLQPFCSRSTCCFLAQLLRLLAFDFEAPLPRPFIVG